MIEINNLCAGYNKKEVLHTLNLTVPSSGIIGIVGLNGAGKTTFFNIVSGVQRPFSGTILKDGHPLQLKDCGYLETQNFFYSTITGSEYLKIFDQTNEQFDLLALQSYLNLPLDDLIETYSTGMKKKLALLSVLKQDKPVYLFDEPFNGLDLETNKVLEIMILALKKKNKTTFISSHILEPLLAICDEIAILENGIFNKTYQRTDFHKIEQELFGAFKETAEKIISKAV